MRHPVGLCDAGARSFTTLSKHLDLDVNNVTVLTQASFRMCVEWLE